jgi:hypothetical protein
MRRTSFALVGLGLLGAPGTPPNESPRVPQGVVVGTVYDSIGMRPLAGAAVQMLQPGLQPVATVTDASGAFRFVDLAAGKHFIAFSHPALDSLGLEFQPNTVNVAEADTVELKLAIPSARSIARMLCPHTEATSPVGALIGFVRSAEDGAPLGGSTVWVRFDDYVVSRRRVQRDSMGHRVVTHANGYFVICDVPAGVTVLARAANGSDSSGYLEVELAPHTARKKDLYIGKVFRTNAPIDSTARTVSVLRGGGTLAGSIRQSNGQPIPGARVSVWGTGRDATTSSDGAFTLDSVPTGSHMLDVRAIGFVPQREPVDVNEGAPTSVALSLTPRQIFLDTVRVLATRAYAAGRIAEFEGRRRSRIGGYFFDQDDIDRRNAASFTDLMRGIPNVAIDPDSRHGDQVRMIGASNENDPYCDPTIWVDGNRQPQREQSLNASVFPERIVALEVYAWRCRCSSSPIAAAA